MRNIDRIPHIIEADVDIFVEDARAEALSDLSARVESGELTLDAARPLARQAGADAATKAREMFVELPADALDALQRMTVDKRRAWAADRRADQREILRRVAVANVMKN